MHIIKTLIDVEMVRRDQPSSCVQASHDVCKCQALFLIRPQSWLWSFPSPTALRLDARLDILDMDK